MLLHGGSIHASADVSNRSVWNASSSSQYSLAGNNGTSWVEIDNTKLSLSVTPTVTSTAVLTANASLFTNTAGYNQDLAIEVNGSVVVWKEAGGYSAYKPATVYDQATYAMTAGQTYTVALYWKTNVNEGSVVIFDGAGSAAPFSPSWLSAVLTPTSEGLVDSATSTGSQYTTSSTSWTLMDSTNLDTTFTPSVTGTAQVTASADVFSTTAGTSQDLGVCVAAAASITAGCANGSVVTWAENGGASTYMPIAALVQGTTSVTSGTQYTIGVVWRASSANSIDAGAGPSSPHSLSSVIVEIVPTSDSELSGASTTSQVSRSYSTSDNGTGWADMSSSAFVLSLSPATNVIAYFGGNASLFANVGTFNIDLGICVAAGNGACNNIGWTESGSQTAYTPDANFTSTPYELFGGTSYTIKLQWRTSSAMASGNLIFSGAGTNPYSPTSLSALLVPYTAPAGPTHVVAGAVTTVTSTAATVTWTAPASTGSPIASYTVTPYVGTTAQPSLAQTDTTTNSLGVISTSQGVPGLSKGTAYTFQVTTNYAAGTGLPGISNLVTPQSPPAYAIPGTGENKASPLVLAPGKGYDNGASAQDGTVPQQVVLGNIRGTNWQDIVTANGAKDTVSALTNQKSSSSTFAQPATVSSFGVATSQVALGNFYGHTNGVLDAVAVNGSATITVMQGNTTGSYSASHSYSLSTGQADHVAVADVNGDGKSDIVTAGARSGAAGTEVAVLLGNGDGTFGQPTVYDDWNQGIGVGDHTTGLAVADLNGDGQADIVEVVDSTDGGSDNGGVYVRLNQGQGTFGGTNTEMRVGSIPGAHSASNSTNDVAVGDFTGNGVADVAVGVDQSCPSNCPRGIALLLGKGDGSFPAVATITDPVLNSSGTDYGSVTGIAVSDMNGDGVPDIVTSEDNSKNGVGGLTVYLATGTGSALDNPIFLPAQGFTPEGIALGNLHSTTNDGRSDVVLENNQATSPGAPANVEVLLNGTDFPPFGSALGPNEMHGCLMCQALEAGGAININGSNPITVNSGEMSHTLTDISLPARGFALQVTQTYNDLNAGVDAGLGYGWWSPVLMSVASNSGTGVTTVTQEDGAQAQFWTSTLQAVAPRTQATLVRNGDGTWTFTRYSGTTFTFNSSGQITRMADLTGDYLAFSYTSGQLSSVAHADGRSLSIAWASGHISSITDANVSGRTRTVAFTYGTGGHANELTQIDSKVTPGTTDLTEQFNYDETTWVHGLTSMSDPAGHVVTQTYNSDGTTASQTVDPSGLNRTTSYIYSKDSATGAIDAALITDPAGHQELDVFAYGEMVQKTTGLTGCTLTPPATYPTFCNTTDEAMTPYAFDPTSIGTTFTVDPNGNTSTATYDGRGNPLSKTDGMNRTRSWTYTGNGGADATFYQPTTMTDGNTTSTTTYSYDPTYRTLTRVCTPLPGGSCGTTPNNAEFSSYAHTNSSFPGDVTSMTNGDTKTTSYTYDAYGNLVQTKDPMATAEVSASLYDADGWLLDTWTPKALCTFGSQPPAGCSSAYKTQYSHTNSAGNTNFWGATVSTTDPLAHTTTTSYDSDNDIVGYVDRNGNPTTNAYDAAGELCWTLPGGTSSNGCASPPTGARVTDYTADGQIADQKDGLLNTLQSYTYGSRNEQLTSTVDPGSSPHINQTTNYSYDSNGNVLTRTDPSSNVTSYAYDADNEVCWYLLGSSTNGCGSPPSAAVHYAYDSDGQRTGMVDSTGTWSYTIDTLHRLTSVTEAQGGSQSATVAYQYNFRNEPTQITYPNSVGLVTIGYDDAGREKSVKDWNNQTTSFGYDLNSNPTTVTFPGGSCTGTLTLCDIWTYNAGNQVSGISDLQNSSTPIFSATYTRDGNGQQTSDTSAPANQTCDTYTARNQLSAAEAGTTGTGNTAPPCTTGSGPQPFAYDNGDYLTTFAGSQQSFSSGDQLCWTVSGTSGNGCASAPNGATTFSYTGNGNDGQANRTGRLTSSGAGTCYSYNSMSWMTQFQSGTGTSCSSPTTTTYLYNGDGLRMSKTVSSSTTTAAWDLSGTLPMQIADAATYYIYGPGGQVLEQILGSTTLWYHHDQIGSLRAITDSSGNVKATYTFDPYGNTLSSTGTVSNPFRFQGQYQDSESGLYYLRARYYDPTTGQFLSRDPAVALTRSPYGYSREDPLALADDAGLGPDTVTLPQNHSSIDVNPLDILAGATQGAASFVSHLDDYRMAPLTDFYDACSNVLGAGGALFSGGVNAYQEYQSQLGLGVPTALAGATAVGVSSTAASYIGADIGGDVGTVLGAVAGSLLCGPGMCTDVGGIIGDAVGTIAGGIAGAWIGGNGGADAVQSAEDLGNTIGGALNDVTNFLGSLF